MKKIPLFGSGVRSYSDIVTRQRRVNCFYDLRTDGDRETQLVLVGTPGQTTVLTLPDAGTVIAMRTVGNYIAIATKTHLYIYSDTSPFGSSPTLLNTHAFPAITSGGACLLADQGTQIFWNFQYRSGISLTFEDGVYDVNANTFTTTVDANAPGYGNYSVVGISSRFVAGGFGNQGRQFNVSALLDGTTWTPLIFATKEQYGDPIIQIANMKGTLVLLGTSSIEFWQDVGAYPNPFQRINGATTKWGCASAASVVNVKDGLAFLATDPEGGLRVAMMNGYSVQPISTSDIDSIISGFTSPLNCTALTYTVLGHTMYQVTWPTDNRTLTYDLTSQSWHEAQTGGSTTPQAHSARYCVSFKGIMLTATGLSGGVISKFDTTSKTDNGTAIYRELCTRHIRDQGNQTFLCQAWFDFELGTASGNVTLNVSKDGGNSFGPSKVKSVGTRSQRVIWNRLGSSEDFVLKLSTSDPINFTLTGGSANVDTSDD